MSQVEFQICESRRNNTKTAVSVKLMPSRSPVKPAAPVVVKAHTTDLRQTKGAGDGKQVRAPQPQTQEVPQKGFIATLKDSYGFIETALHDKEVFFHFRFAAKPRKCIRNRFTLAIFYIASCYKFPVISRATPTNWSSPMKSSFI